MEDFLLTIHIGFSQILTYKPREFCQCAIPKRHCNLQGNQRSIVGCVGALQHGTEAAELPAAEAAWGMGVEGETPLHAFFTESLLQSKLVPSGYKDLKMKWSGYTLDHNYMLNVLIFHEVWLCHCSDGFLFCIIFQGVFLNNSPSAHVT